MLVEPFDIAIAPQVSHMSGSKKSDFIMKIEHVNQIKITVINCIIILVIHWTKALI